MRKYECNEKDRNKEEMDYKVCDVSGNKRQLEESSSWLQAVPSDKLICT